MTRRKAFLLFAATASITLGASMYWMQQKPSRAREVQAMLACLEPTAGLPPEAEPAEVKHLQVHVNITVVALNRDDIGMPLIHAPDNQVRRGRVNQLDLFLQNAQSIRSTTILSQPHVATMNAQHFTVNVGSSIAIHSEGFTILKNCGLTMGGVPNVGKDGRIRMDLSLELTEPKVSVPATEDDFSVVKFNSTLDLDNGETGYLGGVTRRVMQTELVSIPLMGQLPAVGSWFQFRRQVEIEQELFVAVSASLVEKVPPPPKQGPARPKATSVLASPK